MRARGRMLPAGGSVARTGTNVVVSRWAGGARGRSEGMRQHPQGLCRRRDPALLSAKWWILLWAERGPEAGCLPSGLWTAGGGQT